jgi:site-specific recombinase XerD
MDPVKKTTRSLNDAVAEFHISSTGRCSDDLQIWIDRYMDTVRTKSAHTLKAYHDALKPFVIYAKKYEDEVGIDKIGAAYINNYIIEYIESLAERDLEGGKISKSEYDKIIANNSGNLGRNSINITVPFQYEKTLSQRLTIAKQLLKFISQNNIEQVDFVRIFDMIASVKVQARMVDYLKTEEMLKLAEVARQWPLTYQAHVDKDLPLTEYRAWRNSLLILIYAHTGMRASEALALTFQDFSVFEDNGVEHYLIRIRAGKGDKERMAVAEKEPLQNHLETLKRMIGNSKYLAARIPGGTKPITYNALYEGVKSIFDAAGVDKSGFHNFRRGYATAEIIKGQNITKVARQLGHRSQVTTNIYVQTTPELLARKDYK